MGLNVDIIAAIVAVISFVILYLAFNKSKSAIVFAISFFPFLAIFTFDLPSEILIFSQTIIIFFLCLGCYLLNEKNESLNQLYNDHKEAFDLKKNILQIAAHELRSPVVSIKSYLDMVVEYLNHKEIPESLSIVKKCLSDTYLIDRQITSILSLASLKNKTFTLNNQWHDIDKLFQEIDDRYSVKCLSKVNLSWICNKNISSKLVYCDIDLLSVIISNAVDNAIKYTSTRHVKLDYFFEKKLFIILVEDSGVGMSESEVKLLSRVPDQLENNIRRKKDGWGIGISVMQSFTKYLGGKLEIQSSKGFGSKIKFTFPIEYKEKQLAPTLISQKEEGCIIVDIKSRPQKNNILVVDNDHHHLEQMKIFLSPKLLRRGDICFDLCSSANEAISCLEEKKYDLMFIDYHMPGIDGLQFMKFMDEQNIQKDAKKIILTADNNIPKKIINEINSYCCDLVSKGIGSSEIRNIVSKAFLKAVS